MRRNVLVAGASSGLGSAASVHLACLGFTVTALVARARDGEVLLAEAGRAGVELEVLTVDPADPDAHSAAAAGRDLFGIVNCAGYLNAGLVRDVPLAEASEQLRAMVLAPVSLALGALPRMVGRGQGRIVDVTPGAAHATAPLSGWYQACAAASAALDDALRLELAGTGVELVRLEPGAFTPGVWDRAREELRRHQAGSAHSQAYDRALARLGRLESRAPSADPDRVARRIGDLLTLGRPPARPRIGLGVVRGRLVDSAVARRVARGRR